MKGWWSKFACFYQLSHWILSFKFQFRRVISAMMKLPRVGWKCTTFSLIIRNIGTFHLMSLAFLTLNAQLLQQGKVSQNLYFINRLIRTPLLIGSSFFIYTQVYLSALWYIYTYIYKAVCWIINRMISNRCLTWSIAYFLCSVSDLFMFIKIYFFRN